MKEIKELTKFLEKRLKHYCAINENSKTEEYWSLTHDIKEILQKIKGGSNDNYSKD